MRIIGYVGGDVAFRTGLDHGVDPMSAGLRYGFAGVRPLDARRAEDGDLELGIAVRPTRAVEPPPLPPPPVDADVDLDRLLREGTRPVIHQRVAGYGLITSDRGLLITEYSALTNSPGRWGLTGGGIEPDEQPAQAIIREAYEETGQRVRVSELIMVHSAHWIGHAPNGVLEDFHAVRLVYRGRCPAPTDPVVHDADGTTAAARWVPLDRWSAVPWRSGWDELLPSVLAERPLAG